MLFEVCQAAPRIGYCTFEVCGLLCCRQHIQHEANAANLPKLGDLVFALDCVNYRVVLIDILDCSADTGEETRLLNSSLVILCLLHGLKNLYDPVKFLFIG